MHESHPVYDTKIVIAVRQDLAPWQKLNVVSFLAGGLTSADAAIVGEPYEDADGTTYLPLVRQPIVILSGDGAALARTRQRALARGIRVGVYSAQMLETMNDVDNRAAVRRFAGADLDLIGLALYGPKKEVAKATDALRMAS